jgi:tetratricopeptide (TPR) repeat protein
MRMNLLSLDKYNLNDLASQALALGNLGATFQLQNKLSQALTAYEQALALYEMLDDRQGQAQMWANLGHLSSLEKSSIQALTYQQKSLVMYREIGDLAGEAKAMINVANAHRDLKQFDEAEKPLQAALDLSQKLGSIRLQDSAIGALGTLRMAQNRLDEAQALLQEALALQKKRGDTHAQVETIYKLGQAAYEQERYDRILDILTPGWELALENDYGRWLFDMALLLGHAARDQLDPGGINYYAVAVGLACQYESERYLREGLEVLVDLFVSALERGKRAEALEPLSRRRPSARQCSPLSSVNGVTRQNS